MICAILLFLISIITSRCWGYAYNQPKFSLRESWNPNGTTIARGSASSSQYSGIFIDKENTIFAIDQKNGQVLIWQNGSSILTGNISGDLINPSSLFVDVHGHIYVDNGDQKKRVEKWSRNSTISEHVASVNSSCTGLFIDRNQSLYCSMAEEHRIEKVNLTSSNKIWTHVAGTGCPGPVFNMLNHPHGIFVDGNFNLYVADTYNNRIQRFTYGESSGETVAGFGSPNHFILNRPTSIILDGDNYLFIVDSHNHRIIRSLKDGFQCIAGCTGTSGDTSYQLNYPRSMAFDNTGNIVVVDSKHDRILIFYVTSYSCGSTSLTNVRTSISANSTVPKTLEPTKITTSTTSTTTTTNAINIPNIPANARWSQNGITVAGGRGQDSATNQLNQPTGIFIDDNQTILIADFGNHRIVQWKVNDTDGQVVAGGNGKGSGLNQLSDPVDVLIDNTDNSIIICDYSNFRVVRWYRLSNTTQGQILLSGNKCRAVNMDDQRNLYVSFTEKHQVQRFPIGSSTGKVVAGGNGIGGQLNQLNWPTHIFIDHEQTLYVSDNPNHRVMKWTQNATQGIAIAGGQGPGSALTQLNYPEGLFVDKRGNLYVADGGNHRVIQWSAGASQGTVIVGGNGAGSESNQFNTPVGLFFDLYGNLYVADQNNHRIQRFSRE